MTDAILMELRASFGWPDESLIFHPRGEVADEYARLAKLKIGQGLRRFAGRDGIDVGVLVRDQDTAASDLPLAVVCRFEFITSSALLAEAHRLAWNFCHAPILITIDPVELRSWSCFVPPAIALGQIDPSPASLDLHLTLGFDHSASDRAAASLHWVSLIAGEAERLHPDLFDPSGRADRLLLKNLKQVRTQLITGPDALPVDHAHDLIARLMFMQFLFDRRDSSGYAALDAERLASLARDGVLASAHPNLESILSDYADSYRLFRWLNDRFNGDLFPGKSQDADEREREWQREMDVVKARHLGVLADLVSGRIDIDTGQWAIWRLYAFDSIPLEFVSSIYEEFVSVPAAPRVRKKGSPRSRKEGSTHYTPAHLADYVLDAVLPWNSDHWQVRVLDPSCGSGIFLVRAFQRLIHRWRRAHGTREIPVSVLQELLTGYLCGIDSNPQAIRVASFSLYLAMCDEIEPRRYWAEVRFPHLRDHTLITSDFFLSESSGALEQPFDIVVGNAPWGANTKTAAADKWAAAREVAINNNDIGPLFVFAGLEWLRDGGRIAMVQSTTAFLTGAKSSQTRALASSYQIEEITNFTLLRFSLFQGATSPACCIVVHKTAPTGEPTVYICPKRIGSSEDNYRITFDHLDVNQVSAADLSDPVVWNVLVTGGPRDLALVKKIITHSRPIDEIEGAEAFVMSEGIIIGDESKTPPFLQNRRVLLTRNFPVGTAGELRASDCEFREKLAVERARTPSVFQAPQLIIKQGFDRKQARFRSAVVLGKEGVVCSQSYISIAATSEMAARALLTIRDSINSAVMSYYLGLTSGRMTYRPELLVEEFGTLPIVDKDFEANNLKEPERILIEDAHRFAIPEMLKASRVGTAAETSRDHDDPLSGFCAEYLKVLSAVGLSASATVFREAEGARLPLRMVGIHFAAQDRAEIFIEEIGTGQLRDHLLSLHALLDKGAGGGANRRIATIYDTSVHPSTGVVCPTVYLIRPDRDRFWSRSIALREGDRFVADGLFETAFPETGGAVEQ